MEGRLWDGGVMEHLQHFASDNYSGMCPEVLEYLGRVNDGHVRSYGDDRWTDEACDLFRDQFGADCDVFFVFNGTAANSLSLAALCQSYHSVICHEFAHVETDECGAPEFFSHGAKLLMAGGENGRIDPAEIRRLVSKRTDIHYPKPRVVSVTQATEFGTVYTPAQLGAIRDAARAHGLRIQMDGARFANAVAQLECAPRAITVEAGVDVLSFGGSKNGLAYGEAVVFFDRGAADEFEWRCKQAGQLGSKMRFIAAQWIGALKGGAWLRYARHANDCAEELARRIAKIPEIEILYPREANSVFTRMPPPVIDAMHAKGWWFYTFIGTGGARLMCSWDTTEESIDAFISDLKASIAGAR